jgi:hypothetical protein
MEKFNITYKTVDSKMVQLRKDLDIDIFMKHLKTKADGE